jgi:putative endonuclease
MEEPDRPGERTKREVGGAAEAIAAAWLVEQGFRILDRNHATRRGEVDLICEEGETLCFTEVRSRTRLDYGSPASSVTRRKALRVVAAATDWVMRKRIRERAMRFDVVSVHLDPGGPKLELFRGAFDARGMPSF